MHRISKIYGHTREGMRPPHSTFHFKQLTSRILRIKLTGFRIGGHDSTVTRLPPRAANPHHGLSWYGRIRFRRRETFGLAANHGNDIDTFGTNHHGVLVPAVQTHARRDRSRNLDELLRDRLSLREPSSVRLH
eukprot:IDg3572t1